MLVSTHIKTARMNRQPRQGACRALSGRGRLATQRAAMTVYVCTTSITALRRTLAAPHKARRGHTSMTTALQRLPRPGHQDQHTHAVALKQCSVGNEYPPLSHLHCHRHRHRQHGSAGAGEEGLLGEARRCWHCVMCALCQLTAQEPVQHTPSSHANVHAPPHAKCTRMICTAHPRLRIPLPRHLVHVSQGARTARAPASPPGELCRLFVS